MQENDAPDCFINTEEMLLPLVQERKRCQFVQGSAKKDYKAELKHESVCHTGDRARCLATQGPQYESYVNFPNFASDTYCVYGTIATHLEGGPQYGYIVIEAYDTIAILGLRDPN